MDKQASRLDTAYKILMFFGIWFAAALAAYGLSFVPWYDIAVSFWELTKFTIYTFTRWWTLTGLAVTLFIFYRWHRQAIRDFYDYHSNIWRSRRRYRSLKEKKEALKEDEVRSYVNEVNGNEKVYDDLLEEANQTVSESEVPF